MSYKNAFKVLISVKEEGAVQIYEFNNVSAANVQYIEERFLNKQNFSISSLDTQMDKELFNSDDVSNIQLEKTS